MVAVGKNIDFIGAGHQIFFNIPINRYGHFFASIFDDTFDGILKVPFSNGKVSDGFLVRTLPSGVMIRT